MKWFIVFLLSTTFAWADLYSVKEMGIDGQEFKMESLKGKVVMIVNIASQCGYTFQLKNLENLYQKYQSKNFVVLGVPTNDFGGQTPEDDVGMKEFCQKKYNVTFPLLKKQTIQGKEKRELYRFLTEQGSKKFQGEVDWNFEKFIVDKSGVVVERYKSSAGPLDSKVTKKIESLL